MAELKSKYRMELTRVAAYLDQNGRWHVVSNDPDLKGTSTGFNLPVPKKTKGHQNLEAAYQHLTSS